VNTVKTIVNNFCIIKDYFQDSYIYANLLPSQNPNDSILTLNNFKLDRKINLKLHNIQQIDVKKAEEILPKLPRLQENQSPLKFKENFNTHFQYIKLKKLKKIILQNNFEGITLDQSEKKIKINPSLNFFYIQFNDDIYIGNSPEILLAQSYNKKMILTEAVAGTRPNELKEELLECPKEINEHFLVYKHFLNTFNLKKKHNPNLKKNGTLHHLQQIIKIKYENNQDYNDYYKTLKKIHPTPATAIYPLDIDMLHKINNKLWKRQFYSSPITVHFPNKKTFSYVALRYLHINKKTKTYQIPIGCGLTEASIEKNEYKETLNKKNMTLKSIGYNDDL